MVFESGINNRYKIMDITFSGRIFSMEEIRPYKNGIGNLRNLVLAVPGKFTGEQAYVPITVFGQDAVELDPVADRNRPAEITVCLSTRQYEWNGNVKWSVSLPALMTKLGPREAVRNEDPVPETRTVTYGDPNIADDIPF